MRQAPVFALLAISLAVGFWVSGCTKPAAPPTTAKTDHDDHGHDHEHVHHGPHQGHLMVIGDEEYHAEWTHDASGKVTFYILDAAAKTEVPIEADAITIEVKIGDNPPRKYELIAASAKEGKASAFEIVDKEFAALFDQLKSTGLVLTLHVDIGGKHYSQQVKEHDHGH